MDMDRVHAPRWMDRNALLGWIGGLAGCTVCASVDRSNCPVSPVSCGPPLLMILIVGPTSDIGGGLDTEHFIHATPNHPTTIHTGSHAISSNDH